MINIPNFSSSMTVKDIFVLLAFGILSMLFSLLVSIFTVMAINEDAKAIGIKNKTAYLVLSFFFPVIVAIVYFCKRKKAEKIQPKICNVCGAILNSNTQVCPRCAGTSFTDYLIVGNEKHHKNAKIFAIIAIVFFVLNMGVSTAADFYKEFNDNFNISYSDDSQFNIDDIDDYFSQFDFD